MTQNKNIMPFIYLVLAFMTILGLVVGYNKLIKEPQERLRETLQENQELNKSITELNNTIKKNLTQYEEVEKLTYVNTWTVIGWLIAIICIIIIIILLAKNRGDIKLLPEIIKEMQKFAREEDHIETYGLVYANAGFAGGKEANAVYLVLFCTDRTWMMTEQQEILPGLKGELNAFIEPPKAFIYGYYGNARNLRDIKWYIKGKSIPEILERLKKVEWGMERPYMNITEEPAWKQQVGEIKRDAVIVGEQLKTLDESRYGG